MPQWFWEYKNLWWVIGLFILAAILIWVFKGFF